MMTLVAILAAFGAAGGGARLAARQLESEVAAKPVRELSPQEPLDTALKSVQEAWNQASDYSSRLARSEREIQAMRKDLENRREVLRPFDLGRAGLRKEGIEEWLKPVAPQGSRYDR